MNNRIHPRDQIRYPGAREVRTLMRERKALGKKCFAIVGDGSKAHRRIM